MSLSRARMAFAALTAAVATALLAAAGCAGTPQFVAPTSFTLPLGREHPLSGRAFSVRERRYLTHDGLAAALQRASYVLLGETHDNPDHHRLQAALLDVFLRKHPGAKVAFEMLDEQDAAVLARHAYDSPEQLAQQVAWADSGWPDFSLYRPVFASALALHAPLVAAHPSAEHVRASMHALASDEAESLHLVLPLPEPQQQAQREEIRDSHCGHANDAMLTAMSRAQVYKDAFMARALVRARGPVALIAGRGHVRNDRGVPFFLGRSGVNRILSVAFVDVDAARTSPSDYDITAFDIVVFTPRVDDADPCELFRKQLEHMKKKRGTRRCASGFSARADRGRSSTSCVYGSLPYTGAMADSARLEARVPVEIHALLKRAAELEGRSLTDFVVNAARDAAQRTLEEHSMLQVCLEDQEHIARALLEPPEPAASLQRAFARRRDLLGHE